MKENQSEIYAWIERVQGIRDRSVNDRTAVAKIHSSASFQHDARITALSKFINVLNSVQLSFTFIDKHLVHESWWDAIAKSAISLEDRTIYANEFVSFVKLGFVHGIFSTIESSLRILLRALDPQACAGSTSEFKSVYECLFKSKLSTEPQNGIALLDLLRLVRNTIHNNGVFFTADGQNKVICWRGTMYSFQQGVPVNFVTWDFLFDVADAVRALIVDVVSDQSVQHVTATIDDPFSYK